MLPDERDQTYLIDMLQYSLEAVEVISDENYESFTRNRIKRLAIERLIEIIGEAANHVSESTQSRMSDVPWSRIIGMRNKIAHDYGEILTDRIWVITNSSVRQLAEILERYGVKI